MIQYGAESIFQNTDSTITTDDIDNLLSRSEAKSQQLQQKYKDMGLDDLQQFTTDQGGFSAYQWYPNPHTHLLGKDKISEERLVVRIGLDLGRENEVGNTIPLISPNNVVSIPLL
jgi:hypothetical protein